MIRSILTATLNSISFFIAAQVPDKPNTIKSLKVTFLSTMLTDFTGIGEWVLCTD